MNPLTNIKSRQRQREQEVLNGIPDSASYHSNFRRSAYIYAGQLSFKLTEGDLLAIFSEYGEVVDLNLVRDKKTGESRGFAFLAYEDQRSTDLAVDNLNGLSVAGRIISVDHVEDYKRLKENPNYVDPATQVPPPLRTEPSLHPLTSAPAERNEAPARAAGGGASLAEMLRDAEAFVRDGRSHATDAARQDEAEDPMATMMRSRDVSVEGAHERKAEKKKEKKKKQKKEHKHAERERGAHASSGAPAHDRDENGIGRAVSPKLLLHSPTRVPCRTSEQDRASAPLRGGDPSSSRDRNGPRHRHKVQSPLKRHERDHSTLPGHEYHARPSRDRSRARSLSPRRYR